MLLFSFFHQSIKKYTAATTVSNPNWIFIEFCHVGGIGKLFRSSELIKFISYAQIFYNNLPIDWLLESYLADRVCTLEKTGVSIYLFLTKIVYFGIFLRRISFIFKSTPN